MMNTSRRDFVIKSALAVVGIAHGYESHAAIVQKTLPAFNATENNAPAKICLFSKDLPKMGYDEMAALIAAAGFDGIDLTVRKDGHVLPENVARDLPLAVEAAHTHGLKIYMITTDIINANEKHTEIILQTAAGLGIRFYRMGPRFYDEKKSIPQNLAAFKIQYKELAKLNGKYKIRGECQNHSGERFGAAVWDQWEVLKGLDPKWIGIQYDLLHAVLEGAYSWPLGFELVKPYIGTMDIKDFYWKKNDGKWDQELTPLGEGMVDYKKFIPLLKENNMRGPFSIHCEYLSDKDDLQVKEEKVKKDLTTLRAWLNEAGL
jgi:sugar phosphate isomerase/epimerase